MSLADACSLIRVRFDTEITQAVPLVTVPGNVQAPDKPPAGGWCRFQVLLGADETTIVGNTTFRTVGVAQAQLFVPLGKGDGPLLALVDSIMGAFRGVTLAGPPVVAFGLPYVSAPGAVDGAFWSTVVTLPFRVDESP